MINFNLFLEGKTFKFPKKLLTTFGKYKIYLINAHKFRDSSLPDEEFGNYAIHEKFPKIIKKNEVWIANCLSEKERNIIIRSALERLKKLEKGYSPKKAFDHSLKMEKAIREKHSTTRKNPYIPKKKKYTSVHFNDQVYHVYLVDGKEIRDNFKTDFTQGGNGYAYRWVPKNEIWIEDGLDESEIPFIILHELTEAKLMENKNLSYDEAHILASKEEFKKRKENKNFSKDDLSKLE
jgi:hypothetical protein